MNRAAVAFISLAVLLSGCSDESHSLRSPPLHQRSSRIVRRRSVAPIPGRYIVVFKNNVPNVSSLAASIASQHQTTVSHVYSSAIKGVALALSDAEARLPCAADPSVAFVEQDQTVALQAVQAGAPWGIDRTDQRSLPLNGTYVYNADGTGVTVYIIDTGISFTHTEFGGRAVTGVDEVTPGGTAADCHGHGTGVASLVGGAKYGVAKNVRLVAVRVVDCSATVTTSTVLAGVDWVTAHRTLPAVANMSMTVGLSQALTLAIEASIASGVTYAVAAGNNANDACTFSPANTPNAMTVGATNSVLDANSREASPAGPRVDINAPGRKHSDGFGSAATQRRKSATVRRRSLLRTWQAFPPGAVSAGRIRTATPAQVRSAIVSNATANVLHFHQVPANTPEYLTRVLRVRRRQHARRQRTSLPAAPRRPLDFDASMTRRPLLHYPQHVHQLDVRRRQERLGEDDDPQLHVGGHVYGDALRRGCERLAMSTTTKIPTVSAPNHPPVARFTFTCTAMALYSSTPTHGSTGRR